MKTFLLLFTLLIGIDSFSQKCEKTIDPFTNESIASFEWRQRGFRNLYFESSKGLIYFQFRAGEMGNFEYTIPKDSEVLIKLENGEVIKLLTSDDVRSSSSTTSTGGGNVVFSTYYVKAFVSQKHLEQMAKFRITDLRYPDLNGGVKQYDNKELRNKFEKFLMEGAQCMMNNK
ncbi:MAG: hypothetical protein E6Q96_01185 [Cyclobacteriaceae bacterium]|nr:MAG: hypothetical protein E6Q96_01185 [Cyclobacteriaceae bacterium]